MKRRHMLTLLSAGAGTSLARNPALGADMPPAAPPTAVRDNVFPYVEVRGDAYELGYQHGAQVPHLVERYLRWIEKMTGKSRDVLAANARAFVPTYERFSPVYVREVHGLAEGAGISFEEAMVCQLRGASAGGCTAFAVTRSATTNGKPLAGQNQDLPSEFADMDIVLHIVPTDGRPRAITVTFAGQLCYMGTNEHGVSQFANALSGGKPLSAPVNRLAMNHYPLKRAMLERRTVAECIDLFRATQVSSPANVMMCDGAGGIADMEVRTDGLALWKGNRPDVLVHTNHFLTPEYADPDRPGAEESYARQARMTALLAERHGAITADVLKECLADHAGDPNGICCHGSSMRSICGYIAEPAERVLHVRRGQGCTGTWTAYEV